MNGVNFVDPMGDIVQQMIQEELDIDDRNRESIRKHEGEEALKEYDLIMGRGRFQTGILTTEIGAGDVGDFVSLGHSVYDLIKEPSWANLGWLAADIAGCLPILPSISKFKRTADTVDAVHDTLNGVDAAHDTLKVTDAGNVINKIGEANNTTKISDGVLDVVGGTGKNYDRSKGHGLYVLLDETDPKYFGRGDAPVRIARHADDPEKIGLIGKILWKNNVTYEQARGLEHMLIEFWGGAKKTNKLTHLLNKIRSISPKNKKLLQQYLDSVSDELWDLTLQKLKKMGVNL